MVALYRGGSDDDAGEDLSVEELIELMRTQQEISQTLLERIADVFSTRSSEGAHEEGDFSRWNFTEREGHVARLLVGGLSNRRIARTLGISERTVKNHLHSIFCKLDVGDRTQAVIRLIRDR
ncbi:response regulator transcription factor [Actinosynnema sp. NPDC053489]|uniref:response regulator transcription factor n=1 Tax=Actinosynnema sp. NPDC053489 TaxID=3363916 RepID=UPI0037C542B7